MKKTGREEDVLRKEVGTISARRLEHKSCKKGTKEEKRLFPSRIRKRGNGKGMHGSGKH